MVITETNRDKTKEAVTEAFQIFLRNEAKKQDLRIEKKQLVPYNMGNCNERSLVSEIRTGDD